jgi:hypothetical protein
VDESFSFIASFFSAKHLKGICDEGFDEKKVASWPIQLISGE